MYYRFHLCHYTYIHILLLFLRLFFEHFTNFKPIVSSNFQCIISVFYDNLLQTFLKILTLFRFLLYILLSLFSSSLSVGFISIIFLRFFFLLVTLKSFNYKKHAFRRSMFFADYKSFCF